MSLRTICYQRFGCVYFWKVIFTDNFELNLLCLLFFGVTLKINERIYVSQDGRVMNK